MLPLKKCIFNIFSVDAKLEEGEIDSEGDGKKEIKRLGDQEKEAGRS